MRGFFILLKKHKGFLNQIPILNKDKEVIKIKKLALGIGILLFAILFKLCSSGLDIVSLIIGVIGLGFGIGGFMSKSD